MAHEPWTIIVESRVAFSGSYDDGFTVKDKRNQTFLDAAY